MRIAMFSALGLFGGRSGPCVAEWAFRKAGGRYVGFNLAAAILLLGVAIPHTRLRKAAAG